MMPPSVFRSPLPMDYIGIYTDQGVSEQGELRPVYVYNENLSG